MISKIRCAIIAGYFLLFCALFYVPSFMPIPQNELNVYSYADTLDREVCYEFERKTGMRINLKFYDSPGEFMAEMQAREGKGYDVVVGNDYICQKLIRSNLLAPLNSARISNTSFVDRRLLARYFDPSNTYTLPFAWSVYGIAFDKRIIPELEQGVSWDIVFHPWRYQYRAALTIAMPDEQVETAFLGSVFLQQSTLNINEIIPALEHLFIQHKPWVESYITGNYSYYLAGRIAPILVCEAAFIREIVEKQPADFGFIIPEEGSLLSLLSLGIARPSKRKVAAHQFINFMLSQQIGILSTVKTGYNPANTKAYAKLRERSCVSEVFFPDELRFKKLHLMNNNYAADRVERLWLKVKLA